MGVVIFLSFSAKPQASGSQPKAGIARPLETVGTDQVKRPFALTVKVYEKPLLVTGGEISGAGGEDWRGTFSKIKAPYLLSYDEYKKYVTPEFLDMTGYSKREVFETTIARAKSLSESRPPIKSSVVWTALVEFPEATYLLITEAGMVHLASLDQIGNKDSLGLVLLKRDGGQWQQESFKLIAQLGLGAIPWKEAGKLQALAAATKSEMVDGEVKPAL